MGSNVHSILKAMQERLDDILAGSDSLGIVDSKEAFALGQKLLGRQAWQSSQLRKTIIERMNESERKRRRLKL